MEKPMMNNLTTEEEATLRIGLQERMSTCESQLSRPTDLQEYWERELRKAKELYHKLSGGVNDDKPAL